jgi:hypothetical protein
MIELIVMGLVLRGAWALLDDIMPWLKPAHQSAHMDTNDKG